MSGYVRLGWAQIVHRPARWFMLALGVAMTVAIPVAAAGSAHLVANQTVRRAIDSLPAGERTVTVTGQYWIYERGQNREQVDPLINESLRQLSGLPIRRELEFRQLARNSSTFFLAATDDLASAVRLVSGRMPASCTRARCEVVQIGPRQDQTLTAAVAGLGVDVVGAAVRTDDTLISGGFSPGTTPLLVADGVDKLAALEPLALFHRTYGWVTPVDADRVLSIGVSEYLRRTNAIADRLTIGLSGLSIDSPDVGLAGENRRAELSARRFDLLAGAAAALMIGFAVVAAVSLRRDHAVLVRLLRIRGAPMPAIATMTVGLLVAVCVIGAIFGFALGSLTVSALSVMTDQRWQSALAQSAGGAIGPAALLVLGVVLVATAVMLWPDTKDTNAWYVVDTVAALAVGICVLATARGTVTPAELAARTDPLLVALPVLVCLSAGLVAARLWPVAMSFSARILPRAAVATQIAVLSAVRRPLRAASTAGFLAAAVSAVVFAGSYRSTLLSGAADQAAATVPLDATLRVGSSLVQPLAVASTQKMSTVAGGVAAYPVLRGSATLRTPDGGVDSVPVIGLDPHSLTSMHRWPRTTGASAPAAEVARKLVTTVAPTGPVMPNGARRISIAAQGVAPNSLLALWFSDPDGREAGIPLVRRGAALIATLPALRDARPIGLSVQEDPDYATHHQHSIGEGHTDQPLVAGSLRLGAVTVDGAAVSWDWSTWTSELAPTAMQGAVLRFDYKLAGPPMVLAPPAPSTLPVVVDSATAMVAVNGTLAMRIGSVTMPAQVVAVLPRFPGAGSTFVVADRAALARLVDRSDLGAGSTTEAWLSAHQSRQHALAAALAAAPYDRLAVQVRESIERRLRTDPVAVGSRALLVLVAGLMLLVSVVALVLFVLGERNDDAAELYAWEADGVRPATLRRALLIRSLSVAAIAVPVGVVAGLVLARVGATSVAVNASGLSPNPPLQLSVGGVWTTAVLAGFLGGAVVLLVVITSRTLRERLPVRPEVDLR